MWIIYFLQTDKSDPSLDTEKRKRDYLIYCRKEDWKQQQDSRLYISWDICHILGARVRAYSPKKQQGGKERIDIHHNTNDA